MRRLTHPLLSITAAAAILLLPVLASRAADAPPTAPADPPATSLVDQHWAIVGLNPRQEIELRVLVANNTSSPLQYHVKFVAEWAEAATLTVAPVGDAQGKPARPVEATQWWPVQILVVHGGPLAAGASEIVAEKLPADLLEAPKAYRFRAELLDGKTGAVLAQTFLTKRDDKGALMWLPAAALALLTGDEGSGSSGEPESWSGSGTMVGTHEATRVGSEWVEHGSGVITIAGRGFEMVIDYTYDSHGLNAAALTATGTGTGTITQPGRRSIPVNITSATAGITEAGDRHQSGNLVTRTNCAATGTFDGMAGNRRYRGTITMTNGTQTLDLVTHKGDHRFDIQFNAVR